MTCVILSFLLVFHPGTIGFQGVFCAPAELEAEEWMVLGDVEVLLWFCSGDEQDSGTSVTGDFADLGDLGPGQVPQERVSFGAAHTLLVHEDRGFCAP